MDVRLAFLFFIHSRTEIDWWVYNFRRSENWKEFEAKNLVTPGTIYMQRRDDRFVVVADQPMSGMTAQLPD